MTRVNRAIELLERGQPVYMTGVKDLSFEGGKAAASTWADYLTVDMEHAPYDIARLEAFIAGLVAGGPTVSGHRTPAVIVTLPMDGTGEAVIRSNSWMIKQVLARGVHGLLLCHAQTPEAVGAFVESARYPFHKGGVGHGLGEGRRGQGGQVSAAAIWGLLVGEYLERADVWPLNPKGELMLGLKIEDTTALENAEASLKVPGIAFAEWGPGDMGMWLGYPDPHDPPYPPEMLAARSRVKAACQVTGVAFLDSASADDVINKIDEGVRVITGREGEKMAEVGRRHTKR